MDNELQKALMQEGVQIYREQNSIENLVHRGYRKATENEVKSLSIVFQYAPQLAKDAYYTEAIQQSFESAMQDSYRLKLDPSLRLGNSSRTPGAYTGTAYDEHGNLKTQAEWMKNTSELDVSKIPELASIAFQAVSFVTGQYFLSQINRNLRTINKEIGDIKAFLERRRISEIEQAYNELDDIKKRLVFIENSPEDKQLNLLRLRHIQEVADKNCADARLAIKYEKDQISKKDKKKTIEERTQKVFNILQDYRFCLWLYSQAKLLEIYLRNNKNADDLEIELTRMDSINSRFFDTISNTEDWLRNYYRKTNLLGFVTIAGGLIGFTAASLTGIGIIPLILAGGAAGLGTGLLEDAQTNKRERKQNENVTKQMESVTEYRNSIEAPARSLSKYIEANRNKFEVIKIGGEYFTSLPAAEKESC